MRWLALALLGSFLAPLHPLAAGAEVPLFEPEVAAGRLPAMAERLPSLPRQGGARAEQTPGRYGGEVVTLVSRARDTRLMSVYGYSRLMVFDETLALVPDILAGVEVEADRSFTFRLRPGHRWSDGHPFTAEDFRYYFEDVAQNRRLNPTGPPHQLVVGGQLARFEVLDAHTVRYSWDRPHPTFLTSLAGAAPFFPYRPAHYLKPFHERYAERGALEGRVREASARNWAQLHNRLDNLYRADNPDLPTLDPWVNTTRAPAERFVFVRNPYFHRVDAQGRQLPYIDRWVLEVVDPKIVPVKAGAGESHLQARHLGFDNYPFLQQAARRNGYRVHLWTPARGAHLALFPNLTVTDPVWRDLMRDVRFRRALSLGINRHEINQVVYFGLAREGQNTLQAESSLANPAWRTAYASYDPREANRLLDAIGLPRQGLDRQRRLPDGRPLTIVVEAPGEGAEQSDVLQLIRDSWQGLGIRLLTKPLQMEGLRNRVFAGSTLMTIAPGAENGIPTPVMSPAEWAPTDQTQWQWSRWGNHVETAGQAGEAIDMAIGSRLLALYHRWLTATDPLDQATIWREMLSLHAEEVLTIGLISGVPQPVVVSNRLRNVPERALYNWDPGAHFGLHRTDLFWFDGPQRSAEVRP
ncbi:MAG: ABC transporter substrate-binding protein [Alphaproteobacteria bacterium]|nr:ABC transporter substrate-binding protein [Alphaproteobacteria bacterium]